jgi:hypothetical protein
MLVACSVSGPKGKDLSPQHDDRDRAGIEKIDPALRIEIDKLASGRPSGREIDILIRTAGPIDQAQRRELETRGCEIRSVIGNIVTARAPAKNVKDIAGLTFVVYIDKAKKLYPK